MGPSDREEDASVRPSRGGNVASLYLRSARWGLVRATAILGVACQRSAELTGVGERACTPDMRPAIQFTVQDYATKAYIASGTTVVLQDGAFLDSLVIPAGRPDLDSGRYSTPRAEDRPGTYTLRVRRPPYLDFIVIRVEVTSDGCHVQTRNLAFQLVLTPPVPAW